MSIFKDSFMLTLSKAIKAAVSLILTMIISRLMIESDYGIYKQLMLIFSILTTVIPLGIPTTVSYYYKNLSNTKRNTLVTNTIIISAVLSSITIIFLMLFRNQIATFFGNGELTNYLIILYIYIFIGIFFSYIENLYVSSGNSVLLGKINIVYFILYFIVIALVIHFYRNIFSIMVAITALEASKSTIMMLNIIFKEKYKYKFNYPFLKEQSLYAIPLGLTTIIQTINLYIDNLFVSNMYNSFNYAIYSVASTEIPFISIITVSLATVALPEMSRAFNTDKNLKKVFSIWNQITIVGVAVIFPVFAVLMFFNKGYIEFIFSEKYIKATPIFVVYLFRLPLSCTIFSNILIILGRQKDLLLNIVIGSITNIILNFILIRYFGMIGAAVSTVIMHSLLIFMQVYQISKYSKYKISKIIDFKRIVTILIISMLITSVLYFVSRISNFGNILNLIIYGSTAFLICIFLFYKLGVINKKFLGGR